MKKATLPKARVRPRTSRKGPVSQEKIAATLAELDQIKPATAKAARAIALFRSWLADESGYDERVWPQLKKALERERERVGARRLFNG